MTKKEFKQAKNISFSTRKDETGNFSIEDEKQRLINSITNIVLTPKATHIDDPEFGTNIRSKLFSNFNIGIAEEIKSDIFIAINKYEPYYGQSIKISVINKEDEVKRKKDTIFIIIEIPTINIVIPFLLNRNFSNIYNGVF